MDTLFKIDWQALFTPTVSLVEIFLRGTAVYLFLVIIFRVLKREAGALGISDLLVVVLIADAAQNAMASDYKSITEGGVLICTIVFWDYLLDWLGFHSSTMQRLLRAAPILLVKDGQLQRRNLRQELITKEELMGQLREQGVEELNEVEKCYLEADGHISVITKEEKGQQGNNAKKLVH